MASKRSAVKSSSKYTPPHLTPEEREQVLANFRNRPRPRLPPAKSFQIPPGWLGHSQPIPNPSAAAAALHRSTHSDPPSCSGMPPAASHDRRPSTSALSPPVSAPPVVAGDDKGQPNWNITDVLPAGQTNFYVLPRNFFTHEGMSRLLPSPKRNERGRWLDDSVVNAYLALLCQQTRASPLLFDSQAWRQWCKECHTARRLPSSVRQHKGSILIPCSWENHWSLVFLHAPTQQLFHLDSQCEPNREELIRSWVQDLIEKLAHHNRKIWDTSRWTQSTLQSEQQTNDYDCGVFILANAQSVVQYLQAASNVQDLSLQWRQQIASALRCANFARELTLGIIQDDGIPNRIARGFGIQIDPNKYRLP